MISLFLAPTLKSCIILMVKQIGKQSATHH
jgi:hypothetical protein